MGGKHLASSDFVPTEQLEQSPNLGSSHDAKTVTSFAYLLSVVAKVSASLVGLAGFGYLIGAEMAGAYYQQFGADWIVDLLSPIQVLMFARSAIISFGLTLLFIVANVSVGNWSERVITEGWRNGTLVASLLTLIQLFFGSRIPDSVNAVVVVVAVMIWDFTIAAMLVELVFSLRDMSHQWSGRHLNLLYLITFWGIVQAPSILMSNFGKVAARRRSSRLPTVHESSLPAGEWKLLTIVGDQLVVVRLTEKSDSSIIRFAKRENAEIVPVF